VERVDVRTTLVNKDKFVRYQALFPTSIRGGRCVHEIPFGAIERPLGIEFPAQNWADYGDGRRGVALLNRGLPGNVTNEDTLMLSLLRSTCIVAYGFGGGYEPGMSSDTGFELDTPRTFDYALAPHAGTWADAGVYRSGLAYNNPLLARTDGAHAGALPARYGWLSVSAPNIVISAVTPGSDGTTLVRVYEAAGQAVQGAQLHVSPSGCWGAACCAPQGAQEVNLLEDPIAPLALQGDAVTFDLRAWEIKTIALRTS
jgi:alpha-mannosidase